MSQRRLTIGCFEWMTYSGYSLSPFAISVTMGSLLDRKIDILRSARSTLMRYIDFLSSFFGGIEGDSIIRVECTSLPKVIHRSLSRHRLGEKRIIFIVLFYLLFKRFRFFWHFTIFSSCWIWIVSVSVPTIYVVWFFVPTWRF